MMEIAVTLAIQKPVQKYVGVVGMAQSAMKRHH